MRILLVGAGEHGAAGLAGELSADAEVEVVSDGAVALDVIAMRPPDAVVTDLDMGDMDGIELVRRIRVRRPRLPLIVVTPHATVDRAVACMQAGATDFVPSPVAPGVIPILLRRALGELVPRDEAEQLRPGNGGPTIGERCTVVREAGALVLTTFGPEGPAPEQDREDVVLPRGLTLAEVERRYLLAALEDFEGDYSRLATQLGISRKTLWDKRRRLAWGQPGRERPHTRSRWA